MIVFHDNLPALEAAINEESWEWLTDNVPQLADAIQKELAKPGLTPELIRRFVMKKTQRPALAARCFQATSHLVSERDNQ